jgi:hypothetical protein
MNVNDPTGNMEISDGYGTISGAAAVDYSGPIDPPAWVKNAREKWRQFTDFIKEGFKQLGADAETLMHGPKSQEHAYDIPIKEHISKSWVEA